MIAPMFAPVRPSKRVLKLADRLAGVQLVLPWPAAVPRPSLAPGVQVDATAAVTALVGAMLAEELAAGLMVTDVAAARLDCGRGLSDVFPIAHLLTLRWLQAHGGPDRGALIWSAEAAQHRDALHAAADPTPAQGSAPA